MHTPLFRARSANRLFSLYLTMLLRIPQTLWRARHLAHHHPAHAPRGPRDGALMLELGLIAGVAALALLVSPRLFLVLAVGQGLGLGLCFMQGRYEHQRDPIGVDHHGRLYNRLWFNDGYHTAHHRWPGRHWTRLPGSPASPRPATASAWPPVLRWMEDLGRAANRIQATGLDRLERWALSRPWVRRRLIAAHRPAFQQLLARLPARDLRIGIVGGGLFPRTALVLRALRPDARLVIIDASAAHLAQARVALGTDAVNVQLQEGLFQPDRFDDPFDLLIIPLAYRGDRGQLYRRPPAPALLIHEWIWRRRGHDGRRICWWLLKRLNLVLT